MPGTLPTPPDLPSLSDADWPLPLDCPNVVSFDEALGVAATEAAEPEGPAVDPPEPDPPR